MFPFYRCSNWGTERLNSLAKLTRQLGDRAGLPSHTEAVSPLLLNKLKQKEEAMQRRDLGQGPHSLNT